MTFTNRLIQEKSPYLLQHAHNPVDWYPWGNEAFEVAVKEQKPIFLSIGYATCHWCHVMAKESFQDPQLAAQLNETFVNIKVDREELPDVDSLYMEFAQALMSSAGGWPLNLILTPELKPIFAVTYLPPTSKRGLMGLGEFVRQIQALWASEERQKLVDQADKMLELFQKVVVHIPGEDLPDQGVLMSAIEALFELADPVHGGLKGTPKFPLGYQVQLFLAMARVQSDSRALFYAELTLEMMGKGGIYDHLGGGFSRYSVDEEWRVPHFEKMLYDNVILARTYLDAFRFTQKKRYRHICEETLQYLLREMAHPGGGFYSAQDADTEGHEGRFYTWTVEEIDQVLGQEESHFFCKAYGVTPRGNFEGRSVLHLTLPLSDLGEGVLERLGRARALLFAKRSERPLPFTDDKILAGWNGLVIDLFAHAAGAFQNPAYEKAALTTAEFIYTNLWKEGRLLRRYRDGDSQFSAGLEDYAYLIKGVLSLFEEGYGSRWLDWAIAMAAVLDLEFLSKEGAFYQPSPSSQVVLRRCEYYDGSEPSGNGVHCENLLRLFQITQDEKFLERAEGILKASRAHMEAYPPGSCYHLLALQRYLDLKAPTFAIALNPIGDLKEEIRQALAQAYLPHRTVVWLQKSTSALQKHENRIPIEGGTTLYVCYQEGCTSTLTEKAAIIKAIQGA